MSLRATAEPTTTRDKLIQAAIAVVARDGIEKASVKAIAAAAEISPGLVHYHFSSKEAVLEAALADASEAFAAELRDIRLSVAPGQMVRTYFERGKEGVASDRNLFKVRLAFAARALSDPALAERFLRTHAAGIDEMAVLFAADRGEGEASVADHMRAKVVKACFDGLMLALLTDPLFPMDAAADAFRGLLELAPD